MSTRSTLLTPVLSDSESDSDMDPSLEEVLKNLRSTTESVSKSPPPISDSEEGEYIICAIGESRSADVVTAATINVTTGQVDLLRILNNDRFTYQQLGDTLYGLPSEPKMFVVVDSDANKSGTSLLVACLKQDFPGVSIVPWAREHWCEQEGIHLIERYALKDQVLSVKSDIGYYTACAFSAGMKYLQNQLDIHCVSNSLRVRCVQPSDTMAIDRTTASSLELMQNTRQATSTTSTLFGILNNTLTPQGHRLLRTTLLQPSTDQQEITKRYDAVEELSSDEELFGKLREGLKGLQRLDFERIIVWVCSSSIHYLLPNANHV